MRIKKFIKNKLLSSGLDEKNTGDKGEAIACAYIKKKGYRIRNKNFRSRFGEVDIIADDSNTLCFIEVKSRSKNYHGRPEEFVDSRKQQKLIKTSKSYITTHDIKDIPMRFDIVAVDLSLSTCRLFKNAFEASTCT